MQYEPTIAELKRKYEALFKEKTMIAIQRDRLVSQLQSLSLQSDVVPGSKGCQLQPTREAS